MTRSLLSRLVVQICIIARRDDSFGAFDPGMLGIAQYKTLQIQDTFFCRLINTKLKLSAAPSPRSFVVFLRVLEGKLCCEQGFLMARVA